MPILKGPGSTASYSRIERDLENDVFNVEHRPGAIIKMTREEMERYINNLESARYRGGANMKGLNAMAPQQARGMTASEVAAQQQQMMYRLHQARVDAQILQHIPPIILANDIKPIPRGIRAELRREVDEWLRDVK